MKPLFPVLFSIAFALGFSACGTSPDQLAEQQTEEEPPIDPPEEPPEEPKALCVADDCGTFTNLDMHIPDAENLHFTEDGRLFVSGGTAVWEVTKAADAFTETAMLDAYR